MLQQDPGIHTDKLVVYATECLKKIFTLTVSELNRDPSPPFMNSQWLVLVCIGLVQDQGSWHFGVEEEVLRILYPWLKTFGWVMASLGMENQSSWEVWILVALAQSNDNPTPSNTQVAQIALNGLFLKTEEEGHKVGRMYPGWAWVWDQLGSGGVVNMVKVHPVKSSK